MPSSFSGWFSIHSFSFSPASSTTLNIMKVQSTERNLLVASELEFQDEDWKRSRKGHIYIHKPSL